MRTGPLGGGEADPEEPFSRIEVSDARPLIETGGAQVVDVRLPGEYAQGHIAGARNLPVDELFKHHAELALERDIVVVCRIGAISALGAEVLALLGGERVYNLEGGMEAWVRCGYPVERSAGADADVKPLPRM